MNTPTIDVLRIQEEDLIEERKQLDAEIQQVQQQITENSGFIKSFVNYSKVQKLDQKRHELMKKLKENARLLAEIRAKIEALS